jgi:hypothetical protein
MYPIYIMSGAPPPPLSYQLATSHPLVSRQQTYSVERVLLSVHSEDRDALKWPRADHFGIELPTAITNVQSARLVECALPSNYYAFSRSNQNTRFRFTVMEKDHQSPWRTADAQNASTLANASFDVEISEGSYTPLHLARELQEKMNEAVTVHLREAAQPTPNLYAYDNFRVHYDEVAQKFAFGNTVDAFQLLFDAEIEYDLGCPAERKAWPRYTLWGFPSYIGFARHSYASAQAPENVLIEPSGVRAPGSTTPWLEPKYPLSVVPGTTPPASDVSGVVMLVEAPMVQKVIGDRTIYMEMENFNTYVELDPFSQSTNSFFNNDYRGRPNSAFAKIPVPTVSPGETVESAQTTLQSLATFDPPLERVTRLKFKFRFHDGRPVDFQDFPFNFTIAFDYLRDEIARDYTVRVPQGFNS